MIIAWQVFQVKFGHMNEILAATKSMPQGSQGAATSTRVLTDLSGKNFTLVIESTAESVTVPKLVNGS